MPIFDIHGDYLEILPEILLTVLSLTATVMIAIFIAGRKKKAENLTTEEIDKLSGFEFEEIAARLLKENGAEIIDVTKKTGDFGADIIIKLDGELIAVQCKRSGGNIGIKAVQEAKAAESHYGTERSAVFTNSRFTKQAISLADENNVILWDREALTEFIAVAENKSGIMPERKKSRLLTAAVHIMPVIDPEFPPEGIEIVLNKNDETFLLTEKQAMIINVYEGDNCLTLKRGRKKVSRDFNAAANERISFTAGYSEGKLFVYKVKR